MKGINVPVKGTLLGLVAMASCASAVAEYNTQPLRALVAEAGVTGNPLEGRQMPAIDSPTAQLGKALFFSKSLSGKGAVACASCHHPMLGGGDKLRLSIGFGAHNPALLGPGRKIRASIVNKEGNIKVPRNAPTTFNVGLYREAMFHDGRIERLTAGINTPRSKPNSADPLALGTLVGTQALFPVASLNEMAGDGYEFDEGLAHIYATIAARFRYRRPSSLPASRGPLKPSPWVARFAEAFGDSEADPETAISYPRVARALGDYQRSQVFINSPWNRWVNGDEAAIDGAVRRGARLFYSRVDEGGAGCATCHSGDRLTDEKFYVVAMPQLGEGKNVYTPRSKTDDLGRYHSSLDANDRHKFRTPSLLNVAVTGPFGHAGAYSRLEDVIRHHIDPVASVLAYDVSNIDPQIETEDQRANARNAVDSFKRAWPGGSWPLAGASLTDNNVADLVQFLEALTDPCVTSRECLKPWLPDNSDGFPTHDVLIAVDADGNSL